MSGKRQGNNLPGLRGVRGKDVGRQKLLQYDMTNDLCLGYSSNKQKN